MYVFLLIIGMGLATSAYFYLQSNRTYHGHYYEYYFRSVVIDDLLKKEDFKEALHNFYISYPDKIILLRDLPFFLLFGPSHLLFSFSSVFLNFGLTLLLFFSLKKLISPRKAFIFILFIIACQFYIELLAHFYVDLTYFLVCSLFFVYAALFRNDDKHYNLSLAIVVMLMFATKNTTYALLPILSFFILFEGIVRKKLPIMFGIKYISIVLIGFLLFFVLFLNANLYRVLGDMPTIGQVTGCSPNEGVCNSFSAFLNNFNVKVFSYSSGRRLTDTRLLDKFENYLLSASLYGIVIYNLLKKKNAFFIWMFFAGELFFLLIFNFAGTPFDLRLLLPFYFIYLYLIFEFFYELAQDLGSKNRDILFYSVILLILCSSLTFFYAYEKRSYSEKYDPKWLFLDNFPFDHNKVYASVLDVKELSSYYRSFIDSDKNFSKLSDFYSFDTRFTYRVTDNLAEADYVLCNICINYADYTFVKSGSLRGEMNISLYKK